jgi:FlaA1/EpsC-like NDP-sugar epimerase
MGASKRIAEIYIQAFNQIKEIKIEDLLERPPIVLDVNKIKKKILNKTVLVTGAAGSIGSEIVRQIINFNPAKIVLFDQAESPLYDMELDLQEKFHFYNFEIVIGNIADEYRVKMLFEEYKPSIVYHAAAYKHVPMMENNPTEALRTNIIGTKIIADVSNKYKVEQFVMVSTDKAVNPTNVMGASKRIAEIYIQAFNQISYTNFITTRFGNVLGSNGSVILRFKKQIDKGGPVTVTHPEITRYFMTIPEACQLVLEAGAISKGKEIFIFDMGKSVKILDLAKKMIKLSGLTIGKDIQVKYTGLRPGEKLYEELLNDLENTIPTYHSKIMIAKVRDYDFDEVCEKFTELIKLKEDHNNKDIVLKMKEIVPEFKSQNSIYEELDIELNDDDN